MKFVVPEDGSGEAITLWDDAERVVSSLLLYPEARSALGRAVRSRRLRRAEAPAAHALVERLWRDVDRIDVSEELARQAGELAEAHALRVHDAVHLASLVSIVDGDVRLVGSDRELLGGRAGARDHDGVASIASASATATRTRSASSSSPQSTSSV